MLRARHLLPFPDGHSIPVGVPCSAGRRFHIANASTRTRYFNCTVWIQRSFLVVNEVVLDSDGTGSKRHTFSPIVLDATVRLRRFGGKLIRIAPEEGFRAASPCG